MPGPEWFRRTTWTAVDASEFRSRLGRCRQASRKAQYLRIQAHHLEHEADPAHLAAAVELLDELLRDYPDPSQVAQAHAQRASCLMKLGQPEHALGALQAALGAERQFPGVRGHAYLDHAEAVLRLHRRDLYEDALARLTERSHDERFPLQKYRSGVAAAFLLARLGRMSEAGEAAKRALAAADMTESPFRYHRDLGLVESSDPEVEKALRKLAGRPA